MYILVMVNHLMQDMHIVKKVEKVQDLLNGLEQLHIRIIKLHRFFV